MNRSVPYGCNPSGPAYPNLEYSVQVHCRLYMSIRGVLVVVIIYKCAMGPLFNTAQANQSDQNQIRGHWTVGSLQGVQIPGTTRGATIFGRQRGVEAH